MVGSAGHGLVEGAWEILENSSFIIERYRAGTISLDYYGDSIVNSVSDTLAMVLGFVARAAAGLAHGASRPLSWNSSCCLIRDNLTLNVIMLLHPFEAIRTGRPERRP